MPTDIIITPGTGEIEFHNSQGTVCGKISTSGNNLVFSNEVGELNIGSDASDLVLGTTGNATYVTGSTVVLQKDGGNLGIGTSTPASKLDINMPLASSDGITLDTNDEVYSIWTNSNLGGLAINANTVGNSTRYDLFIKHSNGNIGIGTSSPSEKLHVNGTILSDASFILGRNTSTDATIKSFRFGVTHYTNAEEPFVPVMGTSTSTANVAYIGGGTSLANTATTVAFYTAANNTTVSGTERMRIDYAGNVGIGTTSPSAKLEISSNDQSSARIRLTNTNTASGGDSIELVAGIPNVGQDGFSIRNATSNQTQLVILGNGNVGIGTTSPGTKLDVNGDTTTDNLYLASSIIHEGDTDTYIAFESNTQRFFAAGEEMIKFNSSIVTINEAAGSNDLRVKGSTDNNLLYTDGSADKVGIGTVSPSAKLDVEGDVQIKSANISFQENIDVDTGTETIATVPKASYDAVFFDYVVKNGTNLRSGTVTSVHDGTNVQYIESSTEDLGDTTGVRFQVDISGDDLRLRAQVDSDNWEIKTLVRGI